SRVRTAGAWTAIAMFGDRASYGVSWTTLEGAVRTAAIAAPAHWQHAPSTAPYAYSTLQDGKVGLIDYRACEDLARFKQFMTATLQQIRQAPIQALIVDIRRNGGGDSDLNDVLWTSVSNKPFKQFGGAIEKASDRLKREYGREKYVAIYGERAWSAPNGTILQLGTDPSEGLTVPGPVANRYAGPVYLLISTATFSSAMSCALAAKDYGLATLVGEETGEPATSTGELYTAVAPATKLAADLTTKVLLAPRPQPDDQGVVPDFTVATTPADIAAGRDPVMERALAMIAAAK
ncbi:MAG TPA: S41 family peptidase, partial [Xanthobacteraceae bacterium]